MTNKSKCKKIKINVMAIQCLEDLRKEYGVDTLDNVICHLIDEHELIKIYKNMLKEKGVIE